MNQDQSIAQQAAARLELARQTIALAVRDLTLRWFQSLELRFERKGDGSVVTPIDREAEDLIRSHIAREFAGDGILGEERGETPAADGNPWRWVLDPIDGTGSFIRGLPHWVLLLAIEHRAQPVAGLIDVPVIGETLWAVHGRSAHMRLRSGEERTINVSTIDSLDRAMIEIGAARHFAGGGHQRQHARLIEAARKTRGWSDGYAFALLASGRVDAAVNFGFHRWDLAAPAIIIQQAGGRLTNWHGEDDALDERFCLASNGLVHDEMLRLLA